MGCAQSVITEDQKAIEGDLRASKKELASTLTLLLLGIGDSGKSTIIKHFRIINNVIFSDEEIACHTRMIQQNCPEYMKRIFQLCLENGYNLKPETNVAGQQLLGKRVNMERADEREATVKLLKEMWADERLRKALEEHSQGQLHFGSSAVHFFDALDRVMATGFKPTDEDILRSRIRTTAIVETTFKMHSHIMKLVDVGGQRNERRKWIACFDGVTALIYCASLIDYNLTLDEDPSVNRMSESLLLFRQLLSLQCFAQVPVILFLNKKDLFSIKIKEVDPSCCFPNYTGGRDEEAGIKYIRNAYVTAANETPTGPRQDIYPHIVAAIEKKNVEFVWKAVVDVVVRKRMDRMGL